jgi:hypothetical protein
MPNDRVHSARAPVRGQVEVDLVVGEDRGVYIRETHATPAGLCGRVEELAGSRSGELLGASGVWDVDPESEQGSGPCIAFATTSGMVEVNV